MPQARSTAAVSRTLARRSVAHCLGGRQCVQIGDAEDCLVLRLRGDPEADRAEVVAEVELPGWLDAREDALSSHYESPRASANRTTSRFAVIAADRETPSARRRRCARRHARRRRR